MGPSFWQTCCLRCLLLILAFVSRQEVARGWDAEAAAESAWERHLQELADKLPSRDFHIVPVPPFVVIGDEPRERVQRRALGTVQWAVRHLQRDFFPHNPRQTIDIWLLKDADSYREHSRQLFGINPSTPFGYFSQPHHALVMDISTGGGTLVHELVHPLMAANFPQCPAWFDEGLASLYEQCGDRDGRIWGHTNWRLRGLQRAIRAGRLPSFKTLCHTSRREFYGEEAGSAVYYAQARYLCFYLQEKGRLRDFYRRFRDTVEQDPSGYETLRQVLQEPDMHQFQPRWEAFILQQRFPAERSPS